MTAEASTYTLPETVTISGEVALEVLALLEAFTVVMADLGEDPDSGIDEIYGATKLLGAEQLENALGWPDDGPPWWDAMKSRSDEIEKDLRGLLRGNDTLRLAELEKAVAALGERVIGVIWDRFAEKWVTPREYVANAAQAGDIVQAERVDAAERGES